jgi:hypothetical protein
MILVNQHQNWIESLFAATHKDLAGTQDEDLVNRRIANLHKSAKLRIAKLPHPQFMLGYYEPTNETLVYHANFTQLNGETSGIEESKISKLIKAKAWFHE